MVFRFPRPCRKALFEAFGSGFSRPCVEVSSEGQVFFYVVGRRCSRLSEVVFRFPRPCRKALFEAFGNGFSRPCVEVSSERIQRPLAVRGSVPRSLIAFAWLGPIVFCCWSLAFNAFRVSPSHSLQRFSIGFSIIFRMVWASILLAF